MAPAKREKRVQRVFFIPQQYEYQMKDRKNTFIFLYLNKLIISKLKPKKLLDRLYNQNSLKHVLRLCDLNPKNRNFEELVG